MNFDETIIIAIANMKGGVGKTTASHLMGLESQRRGHRTLLVDADPQGALQLQMTAALERSPAADLPTIIAMGADMRRQDQLPRLAKQFQIVIIDCPPHLKAVTSSAFMCANILLLPTSQSDTDLGALAQTLELARDARDVKPALEVSVFLNRLAPRTKIGRGIRDKFAGFCAGEPHRARPEGPPLFPVEPFVDVQPRLLQAAWPVFIAAQQLTTGPVYPGDPLASQVRALFEELCCAP